MKDRHKAPASRFGDVIPEGRVNCARKVGGVDPELCYSCATPCSLAWSFTGRTPDRDTALLDSIGPDLFFRLL